MFLNTRKKLSMRCSSFMCCLAVFGGGAPSLQRGSERFRNTEDSRVDAVRIGTQPKGWLSTHDRCRQMIARIEAPSG